MVVHDARCCETGQRLVMRVNVLRVLHKLARQWHTSGFQALTSLRKIKDNWAPDRKRVGGRHHQRENTRNKFLRK